MQEGYTMHRIISQIFSKTALKAKTSTSSIVTIPAIALAVSLTVSGAHANSLASLNPSSFKPSLSIAPILASAKSVVIINQKLDSLLSDFAHREGLALKISKRMKTRVKSKTLPGEQTQFLNTLAKYYPIDWYKMGNQLFVSKKKERVTRMVSIGSLSPERIKKDIENVITNTASFSFSSIKASKSILLSGPPTYVALVELIVKNALKNSQKKGSIRFFKGGFEMSKS